MKALINKSNEAATDVITHDVTPLTVNTDAAAYTKVGWIVIIIGVIGFLIWACFAPLDKGVPLSGTVGKESNRKSIQHQTGGTVDDILVQEGDTVKAGQVLVRMNSVQAKSQADVARSQYITARTTEARLLAERDGSKTIAFPPTLKGYESDPRVVTAMALQAQLMSSRRAALSSAIGSINENIEGLKAQNKGLQESMNSKKEQQALLKDQLADMRDLSKEGYVARSKLLDLERTYAQVNGSISEDIGNIGRAQSQGLELKLQALQHNDEYQRDVRTQLQDTQKEAEALSSRLLGLDYDVANAEVRSPVDGVVLAMNVFTRGGVVSPGFRMMDVVPTDDKLIVEGQMAVNLVDKVHAGLPVELIFSAFNANRTPHIPGEVMSVGADRVVDEKTGNPYYKVRVKVTPEGNKIILAKKMDVRPGMPVELFVKTGERTMMSYLLKPVFDRSKTSMSED
jgi:protease secretion system membrane fusion protein